MGQERTDPHLVEDLLATDGYWQKRGSFFSGDWSH